MNRGKRIFSLIAFVVVFWGCTSDNEEDLYPPCDTANVTYSGTIRTIISNNNCNSCHSAAAPSGNVVTETYDGLSTVAKNGKLWGAVNHQPGFQPMPQNGSKLSTCDLEKIQAWINAGSPNN